MQKRVLIVTADGFEDSELQIPYERISKAGIEVDIASFHKGEITGKHGLRIFADKSFDDIDPNRYDALILPGGKAPEKIRKNERALSIVRHFVDSGKPVAAICHGPQILISAGRVKDKQMTGYYKIAKELQEAGAIYIDDKVVVDGNLITSRTPTDLDVFVSEILKRLTAKNESGVSGR
jgi:PfpI family intracellular protease